MRLAIIAAALVLAAALAPVTLAGTQGACPGADTTQVKLWENKSGDTSDGNDVLWLCSGHSNLDAIGHTLPGDCNSQDIFANNWNDCVSSFTAWIPAGWHLCLYHDSDYRRLLVAVFGGSGGTFGIRYNLSGVTLNDHLSSLKWTSSSCPA